MDKKQTISLKAITVIKSPGPDYIYFETTLPNPIWPFKGNAVLKMESAPTHTKSFLKKNFPKTSVKFIAEAI